MVGFRPEDRRQLTKTEQSLAAAGSGLFTRALIQPLDVLKIRFQLQVEPIRKFHESKYHGIIQAGRCILHEEGVSAFWKGHVPAQVLSVGYGITQFVVFEWLTKQAWLSLPAKVTVDYRPLTHFACGALAGCTATVTMHPLDVIRTRLVAQGNQKIYHSMAEASKCIIGQEGFLALYKGLLPTILQIMPNAGFQFGFYSFFTSLYAHVFSSEENQRSGVIGSFVSGSAAGVCAKTLVYPLDMLKKRLQVQGFENGRREFGRTEKYNGFLNCTRTVIQHEGYAALFKGLSPSLLKAALATALHFTAYDFICSCLRNMNT